MRKFLTVLCVLLLALPLAAQLNKGNIYGKVVDGDGNALPGVTITLSGSLTAPMQQISTAQGNFRFLGLDVANDYILKAELEGFKPFIRENIVVNIGVATDITMTMEMGALEEEITVTAASPVVESKRTSVAENVTRDVLQSLPSARDPWVVLQQAPGVMVDRENVGGSESGQQAGFFAKGGGQNQWSMDGVVITDPAAISSPTYFDFDAFEEMNITTGGADVTIQGGGININMVTRRGGNRVSLGGRFYFTDQKFQAVPTGEKFDILEGLYGEGNGYNRINNIKDYGFNMGGPLVQDRVWWWMSYGVQDIKTVVITGARDDTLLQNYAGKINLQILPENRMELFTHIGNKEKFGRSSSQTFPQGWHQTGKYHFGSPIWKVQDEHMFGDSLFVSAKYSFNDAGFNLISMVDPDQQNLIKRNVDAGWIWENGYYNYNASRPSHSLYLDVSYFNDSLLNMSHEFKVGFFWRSSNGEHYWSTPGNVQMNYNYGARNLIDFNADGIPEPAPDWAFIYTWRGSLDNNTITGWAGYFSDTITVGRLNLILGARYDYQTPKVSAFSKTAVIPENGAWKNNFSSATTSAMGAFLPALEIPDVESNWGMKVFSPRIGATYDLFGDGKTILKATYNRYGEFMGTGWADYFLGTYTGGWVDYMWKDGNSNGIVDITEVYWRDSSYAVHQVWDAGGNMLVDYPGFEWYAWGSYDPTDPQTTGTKRYTFADNVGSYMINEFIVTLERELLPDFGAAFDFSYRKFTNYNWNRAWDGSDMSTLRSADDYVQVGTIPATMGSYSTKEAAGRPYYLYAAGTQNYYPQYRSERPGFYRDYMGGEMRFNKRLSNRWMFQGSVTLQTEKVHYEGSTFNTTNDWAYDNNIYAQSMGGGSGKISMRVFSHWLVKLSGLYQLPYDFNVSFSFNARQGHMTVESGTLVDYDAPNSLNRSIGITFQKFGSLRLPTFYNLNLRLEKVINAGDFGKIYIMADLFNVLNKAHENRRYDAHHGTWYKQTNSFVQNPTDGLLNEILAPRVIRLGVRFQF